MDDLTLVSISVFAIYVGIFLISLLIFWAVVRSAVLSALRKHSQEQKAPEREVYRG